MRTLFLRLAILFFIPVVISLNNTAFADSCMTYNQAMSMNKPVALDFYADWCSACKQAMPVIDSIMTEYVSKINFVRLNIDKPENTAIYDKYQVKSIPTIIIVNPKTGETKIINYRICQNPELLRTELDNYLKNYHQ